MSNGSRQLVFDLTLAPRLGAEDYLVAPAVALAYNLVTAWPGWPYRAMLLTGPEGAGKSHLATVWAEQASARIIPGRDLNAQELTELEPDAALVVEDIDAGECDERELFHLLNLVREKPLWLLLTSRREPTLLWPVLPDLASRLRALPVATINAPDDALLGAVLVKLFDDRQLAVDIGVVDYIARRIERSIGAARRAVAEIDREALASGRRVTRHIAARVLEQQGTTGDE